MKPVIKVSDAQQIQAVVDLLSNVADRHQGKLSEIDYEDLSERISGAITDLTWLLDYSDREPQTAKKVVVNIGEQEVELLGLLIANWKQPLYVRELNQAGYARSILKLQSVEYCDTYEVNGFERINITSKGRQFVEGSAG